MDIRPFIFAAIFGYLLGSIPFALVVGKVFYKTDVREHGSGNLGGTNVGRTLGPKAGASVMLLDALKAFFAMMVLFLLNQNNNVVLMAGLFATIGHAYPIFANFKGGKSVASWYGFLLGISVFITYNYWALLISITVFIIILSVFQYVSLASMVSTFVGSLSSFLFVGDQYQVALGLLGVSLFIIWRHRANIDRILKKTESKTTIVKDLISKVTSPKKVDE